MMPLGATMEGDQWPHGSCDGAGRNLARLRSRASGFFESLAVAELAREAHRRHWISDWLRIADDYKTFAETARKDGTAPVAQEAWLCALTALEVVRTLSSLGDAESADLTDKVALALRAFEDDSGPAIERVKRDGRDGARTTGFLVRPRHQGPAAPAVVCVSDEAISVGAMMGRLLPASLGWNVSLLFIDVGASSIRRRFEAEHQLQCWVDYLETRPEVDPQRIAVYGEAGGAMHASRLSLSDRRVAAAVCDGGLNKAAVRHASGRWMTGVERAGDSGTSSESYSHRIACPLLVVVGSRSMVREHDALELEASYRQAGADCSVAVPNSILHPLGEVENFVAVDDFIFKWLGCKLGARRKLDPVTYL